MDSLFIFWFVFVGLFFVVDFVCLFGVCFFVYSCLCLFIVVIVLVCILLFVFFSTTVFLSYLYINYVTKPFLRLKYTTRGFKLVIWKSTSHFEKCREGSPDLFTFVHGLSGWGKIISRLLARLVM